MRVCVSGWGDLVRCHKFNVSGNKKQVKLLMWKLHMYMRATCMCCLPVFHVHSVYSYICMGVHHKCMQCNRIMTVVYCVLTYT